MLQNPVRLEQCFSTCGS